LCKRFFSPIEVALVAFPEALAEQPRHYLRKGADVDPAAAAPAAATAKDNGAATAAPVALPVAPAVEFN
jgi:hypothetical protein